MRWSSRPPYPIHLVVTTPCTIPPIAVCRRRPFLGQAKPTPCSGSRPRRLACSPCTIEQFALAGRRERITLPRRRGASEARNRTRAIVSRRRRLVLCTSQCSVYSNCADPRTEMKRLNHALLLNVTEMLRFMSQNAGADSTLAMSKVQ